MSPQTGNGGFFKGLGGYINFDSICMVDSSDAGTPHNGVSGITNVRGGASQNLLLHAEVSFGASPRQLYSAMLALSNVADYTMTGGVWGGEGSVSTGTTHVKGVTADFDPATATWTNTRSKIGTELTGSGNVQAYSDSWYPGGAATSGMLETSGGAGGGSSTTVIVPTGPHSAVDMGPFFGLEVSLTPPSGSGYANVLTFTSMINCYLNLCKCLLQ